MPAPIIWALAADIAGMQAQAEGLADALAQHSGGTSSAAAVRLPAAARLLPPALARHFADIRIAATSAPDIAIGCGSNGQAAVLALKKKYNAYAIYLQKPPRHSAGQFDAIIAPQHDYRGKPPPANVITTVGAVGKITAATLAARRATARQRFGGGRQIAALIGGDNRASRLDNTQLIQQLQRIAECADATLLITPSRRTSSDTRHQLQQHFGGGSHYLWDGSGDNPYLDILAAADGYCVTADSVNMISESCASGQAVYLLPTAARRGGRAARRAQKFAAFHDALIQRGNLRRFDGEWEFFTAAPLADTAQAAQQLWQRYCQTRR